MVSIPTIRATQVGKILFKKPAPSFFSGQVGDRLSSCSKNPNSYLSRRLPLRSYLRRLKNRPQQCSDLFAILQVLPKSNKEIFQYLKPNITCFLTCSQCYKHFTGLHLRVCNHSPIFKIIYGYKCCLIQNSPAFLLKSLVFKS